MTVSAHWLIAELTRRRLTVAGAESLTGGLVCAALTSVPGASVVVRGGVVSYAAEVKSGVLGVDRGLLDEHGMVSAACALAMAAGARRLLCADLGFATTGVAGPGALEGHPAGTVHLAVCSGDREHDGSHRTLLLHGSRDQIRNASVAAVLDLLAEFIADSSIHSD